MSPLSSGSVCACYLLHASFLLDLFSGPDDGGDMFLRNVGLTFNGLHGVISQKTELLTTAVRTSDPIQRVDVDPRG
jgi:hypothetical protein